jgi:hypothetical protein
MPKIDAADLAGPRPSTLESRKMPLRAAPGDLVQELSGIVSPFVSVAQSRGIRVHLDAAAERSRAVFDRDVLEKVVNNLLGNALKFTPEGGTVTVSLRRPDGTSRRGSGAAPAELIEIAVSDNGVGIAPEHLPHVFERFYQVCGSAAREGRHRPASPANGSSRREPHSRCDCRCPRIGREPRRSPTRTAPSRNGPVWYGAGPADGESSDGPRRG